MKKKATKRYRQDPYIRPPGVSWPWTEKKETSAKRGRKRG